MKLKFDKKNETKPTQEKRSRSEFANLVEDLLKDCHYANPDEGKGLIESVEASDVMGFVGNSNPSESELMLIERLEAIQAELKKDDQNENFIELCVEEIRDLLPNVY